MQSAGNGTLVHPSPPGGVKARAAWMTGLQRLGRALSPFWMFKDVSRGDLIARAAAAAHNRRLVESLPQYLRRWLLIGSAASLAIYICDALAADAARRLDVFVLMAAGSGLVCAYAVCALLVIGYAYCRLRLAPGPNR